MTSNEPSAPAILATHLAEEIPHTEILPMEPHQWISVIRDAPDVNASLQTLPDRLNRAVVRDVVQGKWSPHVSVALKQRVPR